MTGPWVEPAHPERLLLESVPSTATLLPMVESAHGALRQGSKDPAAERQSMIRGQQSVLDVRHDDLARGIWHGLQAHRYLHAGTPLAGDIDAVEGVLFADGLKVVSASYRETAGRAELREGKLTEQHQAVLATIPVRGGTLLERVHEWNQVAGKIGVLEDQRVTPVEEDGEQPGLRQVRNRWIRVVKIMLEVIAIEAETTPALRRILGRVANIDLEIERRTRGDAGLPGEDTGDGELPGDEPGDDDDLSGELPGELPDDVIAAPGGDDDQTGAPNGAETLAPVIVATQAERPSDTAELRLG